MKTNFFLNNFFKELKKLNFAARAALLFAGAFFISALILFAYSSRGDIAKYFQRQLTGPRKIETAPKIFELKAFAGQVAEKCSREKYKQGCYETEVPKLMDAISMEQAFEVVRLIQEKDPSYGYCHVLGHKLSARETAKDPSKRKEYITR